MLVEEPKPANTTMTTVNQKPSFVFKSSMLAHVLNPGSSPFSADNFSQVFLVSGAPSVLLLYNVTLREIKSELSESLRVIFQD